MDIKKGTKLTSTNSEYIYEVLNVGSICTLMNVGTGHLENIQLKDLKNKTKTGIFEVIGQEDDNKIYNIWGGVVHDSEWYK